MWIIMSIKQKYCDRILNGRKSIEIRSRPPSEYVHAILWYVPKPMMRIKGFSIPSKNMDFESYEIKEGRNSIFEMNEERDVREIWGKIKTKEIGITWEEFYNYASNKTKISLIPLLKSYKLEEIDPNIFNGWHVPRNFVYAPGSWIKKLYEMNIFQEHEKDLEVREALGI